MEHQFPSPSNNYPLHDPSDYLTEFSDSDLLFGDFLPEYTWTNNNVSSSTTTENSTTSPENIVSSGAPRYPRDDAARNNPAANSRVAFRTKSEMEIMDDGFRWRKYGKKIVKSSPNPRNYYKCINGGCNVKKRVEKDKDDPSYIITTYYGVHNHHTPSSVASSLRLVTPYTISDN